MQSPSDVCAACHLQNTPMRGPSNRRAVTPERFERKQAVLDGNAPRAREIRDPLASGDGPIQVRLASGKSLCAIRFARIGYPSQSPV